MVTQNINSLKGQRELENLITQNPFTILLITADWNNLKDITNLFSKTAAEWPKVQFASIDHKICPEQIKTLRCEALPSIVISSPKLENIAMISDFTVLEAEKFLKKWSSDISLGNLKAQQSIKKFKEEIDQRVRKNIIPDVQSFLESSAVILLTNGNASHELKNALKLNEIVFEEFDVSLDPEIKKAITILNHNNEFPQLFIKGSFIASGEKIMEMASTKKLKDLVPEDNSVAALNKKLYKLINSHSVMLFMKGSPENPCCGFSKKMINLLRKFEITDFNHFDILQDDVVRQGLKEYSDWATYPQLYVKGELLGGLDVVQEICENGEFNKYLE